VVLGDSDKDPSLMENHGARSEIAAAYRGQVGTETRFSNTLQTTMMYVAIPVEIRGKIVGVVRTSYPVTAVEQALNTLYNRLIISGLIITALATLISLVVFRRLTRPLRDLQEGARRFAEGQLKSKLPTPDTEEIAALAESMNQMAANLDSRIDTITKQRNEREAILTSMSEGVLALDAGGNIVGLNKAAARFFEIDLEQVRGKVIHEVVRIADLHVLVEKSISGPGKAEMEITLPGETERCFQVHGTALTDATNNRVGVVLVFNDITRLKKLETIRQDFVANVSHELKTPITAITGSVETLLDGAIDNPEDHRRFLKMIARHADRLNTLVEDLLSLARLESEVERREVRLTRHNVAEILKSSVLAYQEDSIEHHVKVTCDPGLEADFNRTQLEQAVTNLIDNAIKYSDPGTTVSVKADVVDDEIVISVRDRGCGIESRHLPRLFERFYRIDKARSRQAGGTGLGLAIVKHVALAHRGRVSVDSRPGEGSTFRIHLPLPH
jgi:two-component system phosphate regulon sensor histidine kinase PhoR